MCDFFVDLAAIAPDADFSNELSMRAPMLADGLVQVDGTKLLVTEAGRPIVRVVAATFDRYRGPQIAHFSKAV
jgi:oxygen-independent coproporphyrinogen-3 oxidase